MKAEDAPILGSWLVGAKAIYPESPSSWHFPRLLTPVFTHFLRPSLISTNSDLTYPRTQASPIPLVGPSSAGRAERILSSSFKILLLQMQPLLLVEWQ